MIEAVNRRLNARGIFLLFGLLLAFYIRIDEVGNWPVRWDEAFSVWEAQMGFPELTEYTAGDVHPPLYFGPCIFGCAWRVPASLPFEPCRYILA